MGSSSSVPTDDAPPSYDVVMRQDLEAAASGSVKGNFETAGGSEAQVESKPVPAQLAPWARGGGGDRRGAARRTLPAKSPAQQPPPKQPISREVITGAVVGDIIFPGFGFILGPYLHRNPLPKSEPSAAAGEAAPAVSSEAAAVNDTASGESLH